MASSPERSRQSPSVAHGRGSEIKILWLSNAPWANTGYGMQTAMFTRRIRDAGHDVAICAYYGLEGGVGGWDGMTVYPTDASRYGKKMLKAWVRDHSDTGSLDDVLVITLMDPWVWCDRRFGGMADFDGLNIAAWAPVDHDPMPPPVETALREFDARPIAMSRFGEQQLKLAGLDPLYVPHGVDTSVFRPYPVEERGQVRAAMGIPEDAFVVGMVANNQGNSPPRKAFPQVFQAFAEFRLDHPNAFLYLHTEIAGTNDGIHLIGLAEMTGIPPDAFAVVNQEKYKAGMIEPRQLARIYSVMDVLANPSYGEGFGIPIIEAQACGTPVIVTDWTAMPELVGAGWKVQGDRWYDCGHGSFFMAPSVYEIIGALEQAYARRGDLSLRADAAEFAATYDADVVMRDYWLPALAALNPKAQAKAENRETRRAKARKAEAVTA